MKTCKRGIHQYEAGRPCCPQCQRVAVLTWHAAHPEKIRIAQKAYETAHPDRLKAKGKARYAKNSVRMLAKYREWAAANPQRLLANKRMWRAANKEKVVEYSGRRRARLREATVAPITPKFLAYLLGLQGGLCHYCKAALDSTKHLEHKIPLARGGEHSPDNVCWACPACNHRKHIKTEREFLQTMTPPSAQECYA